MPKKVDHDARRVELAGTVLDLAAIQGFDNVTIRSVATASGWSRGVIDHYFSDRDDLLVFAYREALSRTLVEIERDTAIRNPVDRLVATIMRVLPGGGSQSVYHAIFLSLSSRALHNPELARSVSKESSAYTQHVYRAFELCVIENVVRPPMPTHEAADALMAVADGLGFRAIFEPEQWPMSVIEDRLRAILASWSRAESDASGRTLI